MSDSRGEADATVVEPAIDLDTRFDILSHPHRRALIQVLAETPTLARHEVTTRVTAAVTDESDAPTADQRRRVRIALQHNHLPRLADAGLIDFDAETVTATPALATVARSLSDL